MSLTHKHSVLTALINAFEQNSSTHQLENFEMLINLDRILIIDSLEIHLTETSDENKKILEEFLQNYR